MNSRIAAVMVEDFGNAVSFVAMEGKVRQSGAKVDSKEKIRFAVQSENRAVPSGFREGRLGGTDERRCGFCGVKFTQCDRLGSERRTTNEHEWTRIGKREEHEENVEGWRLSKFCAPFLGFSGIFWNFRYLRWFVFTVFTFFSVLTRGLGTRRRFWRGGVPGRAFDRSFGRRSSVRRAVKCRLIIAVF
jgi:hypothetical protein